MYGKCSPVRSVLTAHKSLLMRWERVRVYTTLHVYPMGKVFYLPQHRHKVKGTANLTSHPNDIQLGFLLMKAF